MQQYTDPPSSEEEEDIDEYGEPPVGVPSLQRKAIKCPFCLKERKNGESHILKCYIKACRKSCKYPLCTCPDHLGIQTHSTNSRPAKSPKIRSQEQYNEASNNPSSLQSPPNNVMDLSNLSWDSNSFSQSNEGEIQPDIQQAGTQGDYACSYELGKSKICLGKLKPGLHSCNRNITASGIRIVVGDNENHENFYICSPSVLASKLERDTLEQFFISRTKNEEELQGDDLVYENCSKKNCDSDKCRGDLRVKKPSSTSLKTDQESSFRFCSIHHLLLFLSNVSENKWHKKLLVRNEYTTIESSNGKCE